MKETFKIISKKNLSCSFGDFTVYYRQANQPLYYNNKLSEIVISRTPDYAKVFIDVNKYMKIKYIDRKIERFLKRVENSYIEQLSAKEA